MSFELLIPTMNFTARLIDEMKISSNAIIANQAKHNAIEQINREKNSIKIITTDTIGVSKNRNIAMDNSLADIVMFCDDDHIFIENYETLILKEFSNNPHIDCIRFYCESSNPDRPLAIKKVKKITKGTIRNILLGGVHCLAIKRKILVENNIRFNENVGPGMKRNFGEDSLFLKQMIDKKIKIYLSNINLGVVKQNTSTWFKGYNDDFFINCGFIYYVLYGRIAIFACIRRIIKMKTNEKKTLKKSFSQMLKLMKQGIKEGKKDDI